MNEFRRVLVDVDATAPRHPALDHACDLAARVGARVTLVDVMPDLPRGAANVIVARHERQLEEARLAALRALAATRSDVEITPLVLRGKPAAAIVQEVMRAGYDLVVRAHARDLKPGRLYGPVDMQLLRLCPCPVWLIAPETPRTLGHVLAAVEIRPDEPETEALSHRILEAALTMAEAHGARVTLLQVWSLYGEDVLTSWVPANEVKAALESVRAETEAGLNRLTRSFGTRAASVRVEAVNGIPRITIPHYATTNGVDLVVMGTVGRTGLAGLIMGNTAESVLRELRGSVLAVKPEGFVTPLARS